MRETFFKNSKKVVIKIGSSVLTRDRKFDEKAVQKLAQDIAEISNKFKGIQIVLVSSGAVSAGMKVLNLKRRPHEVSKLQALASIGQPYLMDLYASSFKKYGVQIGQILLTWDDLANRTRYTNTKKTIEELIRQKCLPIINENDTVATQEIEFGDNDQLSALVSALFDADLLILLSDSNGFYADYFEGEKTRISMIDDLNASIFDSIKDIKKNHTKGGMNSKLNAVQKALKAGIPCLLANGQKNHVLEKLFEGKDEGTIFLPKLKKMNSKKHWIAYTTKSEGVLVIDGGASEALLERGKSLLSKGILNISGHFEAGSAVTIKGEDRTILGKGIINFSSTDLDKIKGLRSNEWGECLGKPCLDEVLHRDNFVREE